MVLRPSGRDDRDASSTMGEKRTRPLLATSLRTGYPDRASLRAGAGTAIAEVAPGTRAHGRTGRTGTTLKRDQGEGGLQNNSFVDHVLGRPIAPTAIPFHPSSPPFEPVSSVGSKREPRR